MDYKELRLFLQAATEKGMKEYQFAILGFVFKNIVRCIISLGLETLKQALWQTLEIQIRWNFIVVCTVASEKNYIFYF